MRVPLEGQVQSYWRDCYDLRVARETGDHEAAAAAYEEIADLAGFTGHARLRAICLSHLHCEISTAGRIGLFLLGVLAALMMSVQHAPGSDNHPMLLAETESAPLAIHVANARILTRGWRS